MRNWLLIGIFASAAVASAGEAPSHLGLIALLLGANDEVGGVDEVDTYPPGLPQDVPPEVLSPPLRPSARRAAPAEARPSYQLPADRPPGYQPPGRQPSILQPPARQPVRPAPPTRGWKHLLTFSGGQLRKELYDWTVVRNDIDLKLNFRPMEWDEKTPFDCAQDWGKLGYLAIGGSPPGQGSLEDPNGQDSDLDGPRVRWKLVTGGSTTRVYAEGYFLGLFSRDLDMGPGFYDVDENLLSWRCGLRIKDSLTLWYGHELYTINMDWDTGSDDWDSNWKMYGADLLFKIGSQHFMLSYSQKDEPEANFFFMGPFEETKLEVSWFPFKTLRLSGGQKTCPDEEDDSAFLSLKWDIFSWVGVDLSFETSIGNENMEAIDALAVVRF